MVKGPASQDVLLHSLAILLAVRCKHPEAARQLLAKIYNSMKESEAKSLMIKTMYLLTPSERDWMKSLV